MQVNATAQPLVCAFQLAVWAAIGRRSPPVRALAGYSVGELAAYGCAGALSLGRHRAGPAGALYHDEAFPGGGAMLALRGLGRWPGARFAPGMAAKSPSSRTRPDRDRRRVRRHRRLQRGSAGVRREGRAAGDPYPVAHQPDAAGGRALPALAGKRGLETAFGAGAGGRQRRARWTAQAQDVLAAQLAATVDWAACLDGLRDGDAPSCWSWGQVRGSPAWRGTGCPTCRRARSRNSTAGTAFSTGSGANSASLAFFAIALHRDWRHCSVPK